MVQRRLAENEQPLDAPPAHAAVTSRSSRPLSISPSTVSLGQIKAGTESDRKVILRGAKPFRIMSIGGTDDQVRVRETNTEAKTVHVLTVTLSPTTPAH